MQKNGSIKLLLIDGCEINLAGLKLLVEAKSTYTVCGTARNPEDALTLNKNHSPDIIVLEADISTPENIELIPKLLVSSDAKIIVITDPTDFQSHDLAVVKGARGVLTKSDSPDSFIKAIEKVHLGELWINRDATSRILVQIAQANRPVELTLEQKKLQTLTPKESNIVKALSNNSEKSLREIASLLHISEHTLRNHLASIYDKLEVKGRLELYVFSTKQQELGAL